MASFNVSQNKLIIFISFLAFLDAFSSTKLLFLAKADLIDQICGRTIIDPNFCETTLRSDPRSRTANLATLAQIAIDLAQSHTKSTITLVKSLQRSATTPQLKGIYSSCLENYNDASDTLKDCTDALKQKDYATLNSLGSAALDDPDTCDDNFRDASVAEPGQLKNSSRQVRELCSAILAAANILLGN